MPPLFRYMLANYADAFIRHGEVVLRPLSYFRDYEDSGVRSDEFEGTLVHRPVGGLAIANLTTGQAGVLPHTFEATAREDDIFILCFSTEKSAELANRFNAEVCVEIFEPIKLLARLRSALGLRAKLQASHLVHGPVNYYGVAQPPIVDWALPDRIALRKPASFAWQHEYRFAVPVGNAFAVDQVQVKLVALGEARRKAGIEHPHVRLRLGSLSGICRLHQM